jgi:hypothetical protein
MSSWRWELARFRAALPRSAERDLESALLAPLADLATWTAVVNDDNGADAVKDRGRQAGAEAVSMLAAIAQHV